MSAPTFDPYVLGNYTQHRLGDGGQGIVYAAPTAPPGVSGPVAYKEYKPDTREKKNLQDPAVLEQMVAFPDTLPPPARDYFAARLAWPLALGVRGGKVCGFVMQLVPPEFFLSSARLGAPLPQGLEFLLNDAGYLQNIGLQIDDRQRLGLLLDLARTVGMLHTHGVSVGDLSPKNVLFTLVGTPRCLLIDCDSMRFQGHDALEQVETDNWHAPEPEKATPESDAYKFGLIAIRLFMRSQDRCDTGPLTAVSPLLGALAVDSQNSVRSRRPAVRDWIAPLEQCLLQMPDAPAPQAAPPAPPPAGVPLPPPVVPPPSQSVPPPSQSVPPGPPARTGARIAAVVALLAAVLAGVGVIRAVDARPSNQPPPPSSSPATVLPDPTGASTDAPSPSASAGLTVDYSQVSGDPQASAVAAMFQHFYGAINDHDYDAALGDYDPQTTALDLGSGSSRANWKKIMSTTQEENVALTDLQPSSDGAYTLATVSFRSSQAAGYGPASDPGQTCTDWTITYYLTDTSNRYRILKAPSSEASYSGC